MRSGKRSNVDEGWEQLNNKGKSEGGESIMDEKFYLSRKISVIAVIVGSLLAAESRLVFASSASEINSKVNTTLKRLYDTQPGARALGDKSKGILVFPDIVKGGFVVAGQYGDGA